ncbi:crossover junction endodeoxyribonuclease RuvC [Pelagibaculum spongiae]|uniref:Crossover junction endodeoxyribonuclease RuvC n=1 Tax=Pelagibaculum spongiae TaxID=2080658 RepID=A0A2V1GTW6_9GAMM|nr:crossover junction endodeoxyribonuclease RuvC [Pelagibaculum spongiae]PVZ69449.1 crossover junction endodeoxyribonuclease RuvC [Pelagibaculum spongiae]
MKKIRILGIDPGSRITGYGIVDMTGSRFAYVASGCIRIGQLPLPLRIKEIAESLAELVDTYQPDEMAIEQVFMHASAGSALKLGQARGAAIAAVVTKGVDVSEYSARQVKQSVVGYGAADKIQVQHMVCRLLTLNGTPQEDAADALAVAICHGHARGSAGTGPAGTSKGYRRGRMGWRKLEKPL